VSFTTLLLTKKK